MKWLLRIIWVLWGQQALARAAKGRALSAYLRVIRATRLSLIGALLVFFILQLMMLCGAGALVTGFYLWEHDFQAKMQILFWLFAGGFALPALALMILLSEFLWFRVSGAKKLMDDLSNR